MTLSDETMQRFLDVADSLAFLAGKYGDTEEEIGARRTAQLDWVVTSWCSEECEDATLAALIDARAKHRGGDPAPEHAPDAASRCGDCAINFKSARALAVHRGRTHGQGSTRSRESKPGSFSCPDCEQTFATPQGVGPHRRIVHGFRKGDGTAPRTPARVSDFPETVGPTIHESGIANPESPAGFEGHHRLARMHRDGILHQATCACGFVTESYAEADGAKGELRDHVDELVAA